MRYVVPIAQTDVLRSKSGQASRGCSREGVGRHGSSYWNDPRPQRDRVKRCSGRNRFQATHSSFSPSCHRLNSRGKAMIRSAAKTKALRNVACLLFGVWCGQGFSTAESPATYAAGAHPFPSILRPYRPGGNSTHVLGRRSRSGPSSDDSPSVRPRPQRASREADLEGSRECLELRGHRRYTTRSSLERAWTSFEIGQRFHHGGVPNERSHGSDRSRSRPDHQLQLLPCLRRIPGATSLRCPRPRY